MIYQSGFGSSEAGDYITQLYQEIEAINTLYDQAVARAERKMNAEIRRYEKEMEAEIRKQGQEIKNIDLQYEREMAQVEEKMKAEISQYEREMSEKIKEWERQAAGPDNPPGQYDSGGPSIGSSNYIYTPSFRSWPWGKWDGIDWWYFPPEAVERALFQHFVDNEMEISEFKEYLDQKRQAKREREDFKNFVENEMRIKKFKDYLDSK